MEIEELTVLTDRAKDNAQIVVIERVDSVGLHTRCAGYGLRLSQFVFLAMDARSSDPAEVHE